MFGGDSDDGAAGDDDMGVEDGVSKQCIDVFDLAGTKHQFLWPVFYLRSITPCEPLRGSRLHLRV